jgi:hypothetical protein
VNVSDEAVVIARLRAQFAVATYLLSLHAAVARGQILENYPDAKRGPCRLIGGDGGQGRHLHLVVTTDQPPPVIITVDEPKPPKWVTPTRRGQKGTP